VVNDAQFAQVYGVMKSHSSSLPHQYVIDANNMELVWATGGVGSRLIPCLENSECESDFCQTEGVCQGIACETHDECVSAFCRPDGKCSGLNCLESGDCASNVCETVGVCSGAACSSGSDCASLQCKGDGSCRGITETENAWIELVNK
jgi:hypothetical protein